MVDEVQADAAREVATIQSDPLRYLYGGRVLTEDAILTTRGAGKGLALYDELLRDPQVATVLGERIDALVSREWKVSPAWPTTPSRRTRLIPFGGPSTGSPSPGSRFSGALLRGVAIGEVMWRVAGDELVPARLLGRDPRRFVFRAAQSEDGGEAELRLLTREQITDDGVAVPPRKFVVHRLRRRLRENPWASASASGCSGRSLSERQGISFWMRARQELSQPTAVAIPAGATQTEKDTLFSALAAISRRGRHHNPEGMAVELLEAKRSGTLDTYESLARYMDEDIAKAVLGETLTTQVGASGSRALGSVHDEVHLEITKADADRLAETLDDLVRWIVDYNRPAYTTSGLAYTPASGGTCSSPRRVSTRGRAGTRS